MKRIVISLALLFTITAPVLADTVIIPPLVDAGAGSAAPAAAPAPDQGSGTTTQVTVTTGPTQPATLTPQAEDISVLTKLWKNGAFFSIGIIAIYIGLVAWSKLDKKHAFYIATAAGGLATIVESIRKGDAPTATSVFAMLTATGGVMVAGPGHVPAGK